MLPSAILLAGGCTGGLDAAKVLGWELQVQVGSWPGSPWAVQQGWSISAISLFADTGLLGSAWSWVIHQVRALFDSFPGSYLLWLFFCLSFTLQHFPFAPVCAQCQCHQSCCWCPPMLVTKGLRGDVPAHKCFLSSSVAQGTSVSLKGGAETGKHSQEERSCLHRRVNWDKRFIRLSFVKGGEGR